MANIAGAYSGFSKAVSRVGGEGSGAPLTDFEQQQIFQILLVHALSIAIFNVIMLN